MDEPDVRLAQLHLHEASHELHRLRELDQLTPRVERRLDRDRRRWQREVQQLESLIQQGRESEADPWRKWRRKSRDDDKIVFLNPAANLQPKSGK